MKDIWCIRQWRFELLNTRCSIQTDEFCPRHISGRCCQRSVLGPAIRGYSGLLARQRESDGVWRCLVLWCWRVICVCECGQTPLWGRSSVSCAADKLNAARRFSGCCILKMFGFGSGVSLFKITLAGLSQIHLTDAQRSQRSYRRER